jgi:predicted ATPase
MGRLKSAGERSSTGNSNVTQDRSLAFGELLRDLRLAAGLSQEMLAERARLSLGGISVLERGARRSPHRDTVALLAEGLGLCPADRARLEAAAVRPAQPRRRKSAKQELPPHNLPAEFNSFVGHRHEIAEIAGLLRDVRFVTLVGAGGVGKTRCALQIGTAFLRSTSDGVWLAELAPIPDQSLVPSVIALALNIHEQPDRSLLETLVAYLKRKQLLLILDNCEHVIDEARTVTAKILQACPDVRILATSREGLRICGEETYRIPSLGVPPDTETLSSEAVSRYEAVQLFVDRARSSNKRFALTDENAPDVVEICRRIDGIPLAIELAAARVNVLSAQQLAEKLDDRFRVLTGGDRNALPRQQTMRALIDWSYDLLSDEERLLFRKLAIFAGGFTLDSASAVCSSTALDEPEVFDLLSSLVDKSLVHSEPAGSGTRYRLLESTRQYAREKLAEGGEFETSARAHAAAYLAMAEELGSAWETSPDRAVLALAEPELENLRAALQWAFGSRGDVRLGQRLAGTLRSPWAILGETEGRRWIQLARESTDAHTPVATIAALDLAEALLAAGLMQHKASLAAAQRALASYREVGDQLRIARTERIVGRELVVLGKIAEGEQLLSQALQGARSLGARRLIGNVLEDLAVARELAGGDLCEARQLSAEALAIARSMGAERNAAVLAGNLAEAEFRGGDAAAAVRLVGEALAAARTLNSTRDVTNALCNMAAYLVTLDRYDEARTSAREALAAARDARYAVQVTWALQRLAAVCALRPAVASLPEALARAARLLGYADTQLTRLDAVREYTEQQEYDKMLPALRNALGADECAKLMNEGSAWNEDQAVGEAMLI